jgi:hypothetical protein
MRIVSLSRAEDASRVQARLPDFAIVSVSNVGQLVGVVRKRSIDGVLIDVARIRADQLPILCDLEGFPTVPLILCGELTSLFALAAVDVSRWLNPKTAVGRLDGNEQAIRRFLRSLPPASIRQKLLAHLARALALLPRRIQSAMFQLWEDAPPSLSLKQLAARSDYSPRWVYEHLVNAGFHEPRRIFQARRFIDAFVYDRDPGFTLADIARKSGCGTVGTLQRTMTVFGYQCRRATFGALDEDELIERVLAVLLGESAVASSLQ